MAKMDAKHDSLGALDGAGSHRLSVGAPPGGAGGAAASLRDGAHVARLEADIAILQARLERYENILDHAGHYAIITMDGDGRITGWNTGARNITGYSEVEAAGRSGEMIFTSEDRANGRFPIELSLARDTGQAVNERWHVRRDGSRFWASGMMMPLLDAEGRQQGFLNILQDKTEMRAATERRELLMAEISHRIRNIFAVVQAVADQTERCTKTVADFQDAFHARLRIMAHANDLLVRADWGDTALRKLIEGAVEACDGEPRRIKLDGPSVMLPGHLAVSISLAFHELATNALKYGALSAAAGRVDVSWTTSTVRAGTGRVDIVWRERGGPLVMPPRRRGFGSELLEKGMPPGGKVELDYQPSGLECRLCLPLNLPEPA